LRECGHRNADWIVNTVHINLVSFRPVTTNPRVYKTRMCTAGIDKYSDQFLLLEEALIGRAGYTLSFSTRLF